MSEAVTVPKRSEAVRRSSSSQCSVIYLTFTFPPIRRLRSGYDDVFSMV
jgi:hypothetical protein